MSFNCENHRGQTQKTKACLSPVICPAVYDDGDILAVSKPSGVLSHPNPSSAQGAPKNKSAFLGDYDLQDRRFDTPAGAVWLIHRLDQDASGLLLAARQAETAKRLRGLFEEEKSKKIMWSCLRAAYSLQREFGAMRWGSGAKRAGCA